MNIVACAVMKPILNTTINGEDREDPSPVPCSYPATLSTHPEPLSTAYSLPISLRKLFMDDLTRVAGCHTQLKQGCRLVTTHVLLTR